MIIRNDPRPNHRVGQRRADSAAGSIVTGVRALLTLVSLTLSLACVDLTAPWKQVTSQTGGSTGSPLDTGAGPVSDTGGTGVDSAGAVGGTGGIVSVDARGAMGGITTLDATDAGGITGTGGGVIGVDAAGGVPARAYATGDASAGWTWGTITTVSGTGLTAYEPANGFTALSTVPPLVDQTRSSGTYCASATYVVGLQMQNTSSISSSTAGPVTIYIGSITITPPP
jgi:hypothetical protein